LLLSVPLLLLGVTALLAISLLRVLLLLAILLLTILLASAPVHQYRTNFSSRS
jgi:hypothetical protein